MKRKYDVNENIFSLELMYNTFVSGQNSCFLQNKCFTVHCQKAVQIHTKVIISKV